MNIKQIMVAVACAVGILGHSAMASEIKVIASVAFKDAYLAMVPDFEKSTGHKVNTLWLPTVEIMSRLKAGESADLVIMATSGIDELIKLGKIQKDLRQTYVKSGIGIGMQKGSVKPDLSTAEAVKTALLNAKSVAYSTGPSGVYLVALFEKMGITAQLAPKLKVIQGEPVGAVVQRGEAEIGLQQVPEILAVPAIDFVAPLPAEIQNITVFAFGVHEKVSDLAATKAWMKTLQSDAAVPFIKKFGLDPAW
jgi:molybdate transport system substrate-binding protein